MKFWFDFLTSKKFGWRFKLANLIMGDYLRNYLAVGCLLDLSKFEHLEPTEHSAKLMQKYALRIRNSIEDIMEM